MVSRSVSEGTGCRHEYPSPNCTAPLRQAHQPEAYNQKPVLVCEYAHAMGNSMGSLDRHVQLFDEYPHMAGGFIWDFVDQTLLKKDPQGGDLWLYGGDFGDEPHRGSFLANGVLAADRQPHPHAFQVKQRID